MGDFHRSPPRQDITIIAARFTFVGSFPCSPVGGGGPIFLSCYYFFYLCWVYFLFFPHALTSLGIVCSRGRVGMIRISLLPFSPCFQFEKSLKFTLHQMNSLIVRPGFLYLIGFVFDRHYGFCLIVCLYVMGGPDLAIFGSICHCRDLFMFTFVQNCYLL